MTGRYAQPWLGLVSGAVFGAGLVVSGMTQARKVFGFLDVTGRWDPSLLFVMGGAVGLHMIAYRLIRGRAAPWLAERFELPTRRDLDRKLLAGAAVFGVGWGLSGYCPGPALVSLASGRAPVLVFVAAVALGWYGMAKVELTRGSGAP